MPPPGLKPGDAPPYRYGHRGSVDILAGAAWPGPSFTAGPSTSGDELCSGSSLRPRVDIPLDIRENNRKGVISYDHARLPRSNFRSAYERPASGNRALSTGADFATREPGTAAAGPGQDTFPSGIRPVRGSSGSCSSCSSSYPTSSGRPCSATGGSSATSSGSRRTGKSNPAQGAGYPETGARARNISCVALMLASSALGHSQGIMLKSLGCSQGEVGGTWGESTSARVPLYGRGYPGLCPQFPGEAFLRSFGKQKQTYGVVFNQIR